MQSGFRTLARLKSLRRVGFEMLSVGCSSRCGLAPPLPGLAPAGELLLWASKEVTKKDAPTKPPLRGSLRCSKPQARTQLASLRAAQTVVRSQLLMRASHAPGVPALLSGFEGGVPKQPRSPSARLRRSLGQQADRVARATMYSSTGEPGVQPRVGRCDAGAAPLVTCHVRERSGSLLPTRRPAVARRSSCAWCWCAVQGLFFGDFLLAPQKKVTPPPGGTPGTTLAKKLKYRRGTT